jgi:hypothetical protein
MGDVDGLHSGIHAECDAIHKLPPLPRKKKLEKVNILIVRFTKNGKIRNSKPCTNCITKMSLLPPYKGYSIKYVYYSNDDGTIVKTNLRSLQNEPAYYTRFDRDTSYIHTMQ